MPCRPRLRGAWARTLFGSGCKAAPLTKVRAPTPTRSRAAPIVVASLIVAAMAALLVWRLASGPGGEVSVYPGPRTLAASSTTTITVRGADADDLSAMSVTGSRSGGHAGRWRPHPDGRGATFTPEQPFAPGERVTVDVGVHVAGGDGDRSSFVIARPLSAPAAPFDKAKPPEARGVRDFASRPDLHPPAIAVKTASKRATPGDVFVAPKRGATQQGPMILDRSGELLWFKPLRGDDQAFDFRAQTYRRERVLTWWQGRVATYRGDGVGRIVDRSYKPVATVRAANGYRMDGHEFQLTPAGTALVMSYVVVPWDLSKLGGRRDGLVEDNVVQEIDVETGTLLFEWHALGTIGLGESYRPAPKEAGKVHDPFHLNSIALATDGNLIVSARHMNALYKIDRRTGALLWRLGGNRSSFAMGPGTTFRLQHDARVQPDGRITLFDNVAEDLPARGRRSRGLMLSLDAERKRVSVFRAFEHPDGILSPTQGSMQALDGGGAFVGWGGLQPWFTEFDAGGRTVFAARFRPPGVESYRAYRLPWSATPAGRPRAAARATRSGTVVSMSWNGATAVARWRVRAPGGSSASRRRTGFETTIRIPRKVRAVAVEALDAAGRRLGPAARAAVSSGASEPGA